MMRRTTTGATTADAMGMEMVEGWRRKFPGGIARDNGVTAFRYSLNYLLSPFLLYIVITERCTWARSGTLLCNAVHCKEQKYLCT